jgi:hypothetical protein
MKKFFLAYRHYIIIIGVGIAGYWQVAFLQFTLKWDMTDQYFPWRYFVSECLRNGIFPQWNPYQHLGYAVHADPQSGAWYPIVWIISFIRGYDLYANQFDFVLHVILGGTGMFLLIRYLVKNPDVALLAGCCYMLSGFFIGNAQHLTYVVSAAWIPFILFYYARVLDNNSWKDVVRTAVCFFLLLTGGYPAFTIILSYSLSAIFLIRMVTLSRKSDFSLLKKFILNNFLFLFLSVILSAGWLASIYTGWDYFTRSEKLPVEIINQGPFSPQSLISCLLSLVTATDRDFIASDISMTNLNFGTICFAAFVFSFFRKKEREEKIILLAGIFFLLASFGAYTPIRKLLYDFVPFMDLFRFPGIFRLFTLICFIISASYSLKFLYEQKTGIKKFKIILISFLIFYLVMIILSLVKDSATQLKHFDFFDFNYSINRLGFWESAFIQSAVLSVLLVVFIFFLKNDFHKHFKYLFWIAITDIFVSAQLNAPVTVISDFASSKLEKKLSALPEKFPAPQNKPSWMFSDSTGSMGLFWKNLGIFYKRPQFDGYNPFHLTGFNRLDNEPGVYYPLLKNNIAFFSDTYSFFTDTIRDTSSLQSKSNHLFFPEKLKNEITFENLMHSSSDTAEIIEFRPDKIKIKSHSSSKELLTLMQHDYPGWNVFLDRQPIHHFTSDYLFISILLPAGNHIIEYDFENKTVSTALIISIVSLLVCLALLIAKRKTIEIRKPGTATTLQQPNN